MSQEPNESGRLAAFDGIRIMHRTWHAPDAVAGVLVVHGFADNGFRYGNLIDVLLPAGISVMTWDMRGHGESGGRTTHVERFDDYCDDVAMMIGFAREKLPAPLFVVAHSMGGLIMTRICVERGLKVAGLVLSNPALKSKMVVPAWKITAAKALSGLLPTLRVPTGIPAEFISRDPEEVRHYATDPSVPKDATVRWGAEYLAAQAALEGAGGSFSFAPTLVMLGTGDQLVDSAAAAQFFNATASKDCRVELFEGAYHELFNEPAAEREPIIAVLREWLLETAGKASNAA